MIAGNGVSYEDLVTYFYERYFEQIVPIVYNTEENRYFDIVVDLIEVIYNYPVFGSMFHDHPNEFIDLLRDIFIKCQLKAINSMK